MATLFRSIYTRSSKLAFGSSRIPPLPGFTNSLAFVVQPCANFLVPNRSPAHCPDVNIFGKAMLPNVLASSSKEDLKNLFKDALTAKLNLLKDGGTAKLSLPNSQLLSLSNSQLFEIWCKLDGKSYSSQEEKLYRFTVFEDNLNFLLNHNKIENEMDNNGTWRLYTDFLKHLDLTRAEVRKVYGIGDSIRDLEREYHRKNNLKDDPRKQGSLTRKQRSI